MNIALRNLLLLFSVVCTLTAFAPIKSRFSAAEQQQISIATPKLFALSNTFNIELGTLSTNEYSFPLPVGKATRLADNRLEITSKEGDAVKAMFAGTVRLARKHHDYGNVIVVRHPNGLETVYANNAQNLVDVGDVVKAGQTIAIVGSHEGKTYLNFWVMVNGARINPETILSLKSHKLHKKTLQCTKRNGGMVEVKTLQEDVDVVQEGVDLNIDPFATSDTYKLDLKKLENSRWAYPLPGAKVISPYGGKRRHAGVDLKTKANDEIVAAFDGEVMRSGKFYGYGNCIVIKHSWGLETLYGHQSKNLVKVGDKVKAGQVIGLTGRTGRATTEHLHFETTFRGRRFNPNILFDHANRKLQQSTLTLKKNGSLLSKKN